MTVKLINITHKPCRVFVDDIILTIHAGRQIAETKSKDGILSKDEIQWMQDNTLSDATGDNISELNRFYNEMTAIYWVWKNYEKIGNPEIIGCMHYRRHFILKDKLSITGEYLDDLGLTYENITNIMKEHDLITPKFMTMKGSPFIEKIGKELCTLGGDKMKEAMSLCLDIIKDIHPKYYNEMQSILKGYNTGSFCNMFIMKKDLFFEYCNWIFPILFELDNRLGRNYEKGQERCIGWTSEMLTSMFIYMKSKSIPHKEVLVFNQSPETIKSFSQIIKYKVKQFFQKGKKNNKHINYIYNYELFNKYCKGKKEWQM